VSDLDCDIRWCDAEATHAYRWDDGVVVVLCETHAEHYEGRVQPLSEVADQVAGVEVDG